MKGKMFLGIDTSNYMTSTCIIDEGRNVLYEGKKLLEVKQGKRGLQQSEAVFQHIKNLPILFRNARDLEQHELKAIAVSSRPRPSEGSYMPVFLPGLSIGESIAALYRIPLYYTTHQEGHIAAGIYSIKEPPKQSRFLATHLSGGTSEILHVETNETGYNIDKIGGTLDIHAGQLVDRIGVMFGLSFPSGKNLEILAKESGKDFIRIPSSVKDLSFHFSGAETQAIRLFNQNLPKENIARAIEHVIAATLEKSLRKALELGYPKEILIVGGVAQNQYIRERLSERLEHPSVNAKLFYADKSYSGDNAFGVANIALNNFLQKS